MKGLILAAGLGTRLRPITFAIPKPLVPIANKPTFLYAVESFINCGIKDIGIVINKEHKKNFEQAIGSSDICKDITITYIYQPDPKGIAHAISCARDFLSGDCFIVQLGDNIIFHDYKSFIEKKSRCKILLAPVNDVSRYGIAEFEGKKIINLIEKPIQSDSNLALVGLYLFSPEIFDFIDRLTPSPRGEYEITHAINNILYEYDELDYEICDEWWKDTGIPQDMLEANKYILERVMKTNTVFGNSVNLIETNFKNYVSIGSNCEFSNCIIDNSIILDNVKIKDINIVNSIVGHNSTVIGPKTVRTKATLILGNDSVVSF